MAFLAPLLGPELLAAGEAAGSYLLGKEGISGVKRLANMGMSLFSKRNKSPSALLSSLANKGIKTLQDPNEVKHVLEKGGQALNVATSAAKHFAGVLGRHNIISQDQMGKFTHGLGGVNNTFHNALGKLGKIHGTLMPFLKK